MNSCYVSHSCPQCGADVLFTEKTTGTRCRYCDTGFLVLGGRSAWLNFLIKPRLEAKETARAVTETAIDQGWDPPMLRSVMQFFLPYYRTTSQVVRLIRGEKRVEGPLSDEIVEKVKTRYADVMRPAYEDLWSGLFSPGVRAQALKLYVATRENAGKLAFVPVKAEKEEFLQDTKSGMTSGLSEPGLKIFEEKTFFISGRHTVIYFPLSMAEVREKGRPRWLLFDAVGGSYLREITRNDMETLLDSMGLSGDRSPGEGRLKLVPLICPECAGDLDDEQYAVVRFCRGCGRGWETAGNRLKERECLWTGEPESKNEKDILYLPFWRRKYSDRILHVPAFGIRSPRLLYNVSLHYLRAGFSAEPIPYSRRLRIRRIPALLHPDEVGEVEKMASARRAEGADVDEKKSRQTLLMIPFRRRGTDLVDLIHGIAVPVSCLEGKV